MASAMAPVTSCVGAGAVSPPSPQDRIRIVVMRRLPVSQAMSGPAPNGSGNAGAAGMPPAGMKSLRVAGGCQVVVVWLVGSVNVRVRSPTVLCASTLVGRSPIGPTRPCYASSLAIGARCGRWPWVQTACGWPVPVPMRR